jgi:hypothetical protein
MLGKPGEGDQRRGIGNLRGFVQKDARIFEPEDFFDTLLVVEAADPDLRAVLEFEETVLPVFFQRHAAIAELHHVRQRVERDRGARRVRVKAQDRVARAGRLFGAREDGADDQEGLS